jgi:hypothetical protein
LNAGKDIENRTWKTQVRGRVLLHAAKGMTRDEWLRGLVFAEHLAKAPVDVLRQARFETLQRGGIVGSVEIVDCLTVSDSPWYMGQIAFVLRDPRPMSFIPCKGALNFFEVPDALLEEQGVDVSLHR